MNADTVRAILRMFDSGMNSYQIATRLKIPENLVVRVLLRNGRRIA